MSLLRRILLLSSVAVALASPAAAQETIDFENLSAGTIVGEVFANGGTGSGPIEISGLNPALGEVNAAMIYDSSCPPAGVPATCSGDDTDLGTPNEAFGGPGVSEDGSGGSNTEARGNLLVIAENLDDMDGDGLVDDPDDADEENETFVFRFGQIAPVTIHSLVIMDVEPVEMSASVKLYDAGDNLIDTVDLPTTGDNGVATQDIGVSGVFRMVVNVNGSGAIDDVVFDIDALCGDGELDEGEECDDGNNVDGDGCAADCTIEPPVPFCGDGNVDSGEECDDGNTDDGDGCAADCTLEPFCGDGVLDLGEQCDDGNTIDGDGCSSECTIEVPVPFCGDGNVDVGEQCDDGNTIDGDGCSSNCTVEVPTCPLCRTCAVCGNGIVETPETCDDGNTASGDGCSALCQVEAAPGTPGGPEVIDFESLAEGTIATEVFASSGSGPIQVAGFNPALGNVNAALIYDSSCPPGGTPQDCSGDDSDLGTPNVAFGGPGVSTDGSGGSNTKALGKLLVIAENLDDADGDGIVDDPDDADEENETFVLRFEAIGPVRIHSMMIMDVESVEMASSVNLYDADDNLITTVDLPQTGDNGVAKQAVDVGGVLRMVVNIHGSGAIDNIVFEVEPFCGDGSLDPGEQCDDGNNVDGDGCDADCGIERPDDCPECPTCPFCGDGEVDAGEECDDGNTVGGDGCSSDCTLEPFCGDGNVDSGEQCDDGNNVDGDGCQADCTFEPVCGDGRVDAGEECDDGNLASGDGCDDECRIETPGPVEPICGNGIVENGEECDDGNLANGDGCDDECRIETPGPVEPVCGNGILENGEECDDGNLANGDGCDDECRIEDVGDEEAGCTPGFWRNHTSEWEPTGLDPDDSFDETFGVEAFGDRTLLEALEEGGGDLDALGRHAVAALLNALHPSVNFGADAEEVIEIVQDAIDDGDVEDAKDELEELNEEGECPLSGSAEPHKPGDVNGDGRVTATDALMALNAAVGAFSCEMDMCDLDGSNTVTASDALGILRMAVNG